APNCRRGGHIATGKVLRSGKSLGDPLSVLDQGRSPVQPLERRVDIGDVLARYDDVIGRQLVSKIFDRLLEGEVVRRAVDVNARCFQSGAGVVRSPRPAKAGNHIDAEVIWIEIVSEQRDHRLRMAVVEAGEDKQNSETRNGHPETKGSAT